MHDTFGTETALKYHTDDLMQQAEHERQMRQLDRMQSEKRLAYPARIPVHLKVELVQTRYNTLCEIVIEGE